MAIVKLHLMNFRNFEEKLIEFSEKLTVIVGANAIGKTNILESLYLLSHGSSFKARIETEMIAYDKEIARVKAKVENSESGKLEVVLTHGVLGNAGHTKKVSKKRLLVNEIARRKIDFIGHFNTVLFAPQDLELVTESPSIRRNFLDSVLTQTDREYTRSLLSYEKAVRQRNKLLIRIREEGLPRGQLIFWDQLLIKNGDYLSQKREELITFINKYPSPENKKFSVVYDKSAISEARLEKYSNEEVAAGKTLVGPHRDDFIFQISKRQSSNTDHRELSRYGSRGEQRMGVLWLKLAELKYIESKVGYKPTLLLDDIFSELDHEHRTIVIDAIKNHQVILTTADPHFIEDFKIGTLIEL